MIFLVILLIGAVALLIGGPLYLALSSEKRMKKMNEFTPLKRRIHHILHWAAAIIIGGLVIFILGAIVYINLSRQ